VSITHDASDLPSAEATSPDGAVEYLTPTRAGVGTRFRATRINKSKSMTFEQEVTDYVPGQRYCER
jgi:hypothetical protein